MKLVSHAQPIKGPKLAWASIVFAGVIAPATTMLLLANAHIPTPLVLVVAPILAIGLMGAGMIGAAAAGRFWTGIMLALISGIGLILLAVALGAQSPLNLLMTALVALVASISFAARGVLFVRSSAGKGWWIAVSVVAGEAALLITASAQPGMLPDWLLVLLPAQWANIALQSALTGTASGAASAALLALGGTAAATLLVVRLWPRRWPYLIMFTTWLGFSAVVWHQSEPPKHEISRATTAPSAQVCPQ